MLRPADDLLIQGLAQGRAEAFAALYDRFAASLYQVALALLRSPQDAEDAVQEVFAGLVRAGSRLHQVENLRAYLFAALRHATARIAASTKRSRSLSPEEMVQLASPQSGQCDSDTALRLERALQTLPQEQRQVVALKIDGGLTFAEIAAELSISGNTAASRYRYALEKLRAALET